MVQEAFCGLYRNWARIADPAAALPYLRALVLNGCRSAIRIHAAADAAAAEIGPADIPLVRLTGAASSLISLSAFARVS